MMKFFRNIRQNLLSGGKTRKYLKYAIGEIVIVVVGVLTALLLNNLNEQRKEEVTRQTCYHQLLEDFKKDKIYVQEKTLYLDSTINVYDRYLKTYKDLDVELDQALDNILHLGMGYVMLYFNTNTIETLQNTGEIKLMPINIRNKLIDLKRLQNQVIIISNVNRNEIQDMLKQVSVEFGGVLMFRLNLKSKLAKVLNFERKYESGYLQLESFQNWKTNSERIDLDGLKEVLSAEDNIVNLINEELNK